MNRILVICLVLAAVADAAVLNYREGEFHQSNYPQGRIVNGYNAQKGQAPYIVQFHYNGSNKCGGSIIHPNWVLTAAHCRPSSEFDILAGMHSRNDKSKAQIRKVNITNFIGHKYYMFPRVWPNDIGLVYVTPGFVLDPTGEPPVDKISLPSGKYSETGKGKIFGWGFLLNDSLPMELQTGDVNIIGYDECKRRFEMMSGDTRRLRASNICTYTEGVFTSPDQYDSGGPLVTYTPEGPELVGLASWVPSAYRMPSVYTRISAFRDWISETITNFTLPETLPNQI